MWSIIKIHFILRIGRKGAASGEILIGWNIWFLESEWKWLRSQLAPNQFIITGADWSRTAGRSYSLAFMVFAFYFVVQSSEKATVWLNKQTNEEFQERHDQFPKYALVKFLKVFFMKKLPNNDKTSSIWSLGRR